MRSVCRLLRIVTLGGGMILPALSAQDVVVLSNGQRLVGTLNMQAQADDDQIEIQTPAGLLRVRKDLIARVDEGFETRRSRVQDTDATSLHALAKWCIEHGMKDKALELLELADKLPDRDIEALALHARLVDELKSPEEALALYLGYRDGGGQDSETLSRLQELLDFKGEGDAGIKPQVAAQNRTPTVTEGLEARGWEVESLQWSNQVNPQIVPIINPDGSKNQVLQLEFTGGDKDKASVKKSLRQSLEATPMLTVWAQNKSEMPVKLAVAVKTGKYVFHESPALEVPKGGELHALRFNLVGKNFKSEASQWAYTATVTDLNDVKEIQFLIYNGPANGTLVLDEIQFLTPKDM